MNHHLKPSDFASFFWLRSMTTGYLAYNNLFSWIKVSEQRTSLIIEPQNEGEVFEFCYQDILTPCWTVLTQFLLHITPLRALSLLLVNIS